MNVLLNPSISQICVPYCNSVFKTNEKYFYSKFPGLSIVRVLTVVLGIYKTLSRNVEITLSKLA